LGSVRSLLFVEIKSEKDLELHRSGLFGRSLLTEFVVGLFGLGYKQVAPMEQD